MSVTIRLELKEAAQLIARLGNRAPAALKRAATSIGLRALAEVQKETRRVGTFNTGNMLRAWFSQPEHIGNSYGVLIGNKASYSAVMEYGRRPNSKMPPVEAIARWAQRKLRLPYAKAKSVGFAIARSIAKKGIKGRFILTGPNMRKKFKKIMQEETLHELLVEWERP